jgi:hypothetical protein
MALVNNRELGEIVHRFTRFGKTAKRTLLVCLLLVLTAQPLAVLAQDVECPDGRYMTEEQKTLMDSGVGYYDLCVLPAPEIPAGGGGGPTGPLVGCDTAEQIYNYFRAMTDPDSGQPAFQDYMIAAIIGNFMAEAGPGLNPTTTNSIGAYGLAQWLGGRKSALQSRPGYDTVQVQLDFAREELMSSHRRAYDALRAAPNVNIASDEWERTFEISGGELLAERRAFSRGILNQISTGEWCPE